MIVMEFKGEAGGGLACLLRHDAPAGLQKHEADMKIEIPRRQALRAGIAAAAGLTLASSGGPALADIDTTALAPSGATALRDLAARLARAPRRRDFKTVPMILDDPDQWDHEALTAILAYASPYKQVWDNTDIVGPWLNLMRNSVNVQVWAFKHPEFLAVSVTHGTANIALYDQPTWDKYKLGELTGGKLKTNTMIVPKSAQSSNPADYENSAGAFSPEDNSIPALMARGVVFTSCHNAIWEQAAALLKIDVNPDKLSQDALAADLTNHLLPGVVLTPGAVGTLPELERAGFGYAK